MVKTKFSTKVVAIILAIIMILSVFTIILPKATQEPAISVSAAEANGLTAEKNAYRRANPGLYETGTTTLAKDSSGNEMTWNYMITNKYINVNDDTHTGGAGKWLKLPQTSTTKNLVGDLVCGAVDNLTSLNGAFTVANNLTEIDIYNLDTSKVINMTSMFSDCMSITFLDLSSLKTDNVTSFNNMFKNCSKLIKVNVSNLNTAKATTLNSMFYGCESLHSLDLTNFDTNNVTDMGYMFNNCKALKELNISSFNLSNISSFYSFANGLSALTRLYVPQNMGSQSFSIKFSNAVYHYAETSAPAVKVTTVSSTYQGKIIELFDSENYSLAGFAGLYETGTSDFCYYGGTCSWDFLIKKNYVSVSDGKLVVSKNLPKGDLVLGELSGVTSLNNSFSSSQFTKIDFGELDVSNITDMTATFQSCSKLTEIDMGNLDASKVSSFAWTFANCTSLTALDLSGFSMQNAQDVTEMFYNCTALKTIKTPSQVSDVVTFNNSSLTSMYYKNQATGEVYSNKNAVLPTNATIVYTDYTVPTLSSAQKEERRNTYGAGIYLPGTMTLIKSWDEIVDDVVVDYGGVITLDTFNLADGDCDIVCGVATVNAVSLADCIFDADLTNLIFENFDNFYAQSTNLSSIEFPSSAKNVAVATSLEFHCASNLEKVDLSIFDLSSAYCDWGSILYFEECTSLKEVKLPKGVSSTTFNDTGLTETFKSCISDAILSDTDSLIDNDVIYLTDYTPTLTPGGSDTPDTPSTGVATDMMGLIVTAVIVVAICYVATRKKKVQR